MSGGATARAIGALKLAKGLLLLAIAAGALKLLHHDVAEKLETLSRQVHSELALRTLHAAMRRAVGVDDHTLEKASAAGFVYGTLLSVEGIGLLRDRHWAHWLSLVVTSSFLPFEGWELHHRFTIVRLVVLILNLLIVAYLVRRIVQDRRERRASYA